MNINGGVGGAEKRGKARKSVFCKNLGGAFLGHFGGVLAGQKAAKFVNN